MVAGDESVRSWITRGSCGVSSGWRFSRHQSQSSGSVAFDLEVVIHSPSDWLCTLLRMWEFR